MFNFDKFLDDICKVIYLSKSKSLTREYDAIKINKASFSLNYGSPSTILIGYHMLVVWTTDLPKNREVIVSIYTDQGGPIIYEWYSDLCKEKIKNEFLINWTETEIKQIDEFVSGLKLDFI